MIKLIINPILHNDSNVFIKKEDTDNIMNNYKLNLLKR